MVVPCFLVVKGVNHSLKNRTGDRTDEVFGSRFTGRIAGSNRFDVGFLVVKIIFLVTNVLVYK
jgi:hypothetical protein